MLRPIAATLALLAATPAVALSASSAACNDQSAELVSDARGTRLTVNGEEVPLDPGFGFEDLVCVSRNDDTLFGVTRVSSETEAAYLLLDPETLDLTEVTAQEAAELGFFETEDDWELGLLDDDED